MTRAGEAARLATSTSSACATARRTSTSTPRSGCRKTSSPMVISTKVTWCTGRRLWPVSSVRARSRFTSPLRSKREATSSRERIQVMFRATLGDGIIRRRTSANQNFHLPFRTLAKRTIESERPQRTQHVIPHNAWILTPLSKRLSPRRHIARIRARLRRRQ